MIESFFAGWVTKAMSFSLKKENISLQFLIKTKAFIIASRDKTANKCETVKRITWKTQTKKKQQAEKRQWKKLSCMRKSCWKHEKMFNDRAAKGCHRSTSSTKSIYIKNEMMVWVFSSLSFCILMSKKQEEKGCLPPKQKRIPLVQVIISSDRLNSNPLFNLSWWK